LTRSVVDFNNIGSWNNPGFGQTEGRPVICINWQDAKAYLSWLNKRIGNSFYRLPSEAEWEYAARAMVKTTRYWGEDRSNENQCNHANAADVSYNTRYSHFETRATKCDDGFVETSPVGKFGEKAFGLADMLGNAAEWTEDCAHSNYEGAPVDGMAWLYNDNGRCDFRVIRGGSWSWNSSFIRSASRYWVPQDARNSTIGFRVFRVLTENTTSE